ncbi:hypothetical protein Q5P01_007119 [Channa striata]|uniref:Immunoglobulin V-set domain-containing protein n=1 Tax=Channa striata TaxID=64152 RepID=A0AA88T196_CHASR|nr:hypothetical protein Q5P01_007119 [Channa striata]
MFFCREPCLTVDDVLIKTNDVKAQNGRYSVEYMNGSVVGLYVTITQVTKSDSGGYRCGYGDPLSSASYFSFIILVVSASTVPNDCWYVVLSVSLVSVLFSAVCLVLLYKWNKRSNMGRTTRGRKDDTNIRISVIYEN